MEYIETDFRRANGDFLLHAIANRSLDLTIDALGRDKFQQEFETYQKLRALATEMCQANTTFPCSKTGEWQEGYKENCYEFDIGCGHRCIDNVLDQYESGQLSLQ